MRYAAGVLLLVVCASNAGASDDWFSVYSVASNVFAISEPRQAEGVTSFLIVGSKKAVLFDSGLGVGRISGVVQRLTTLPAHGPPAVEPSRLLDLQKTLRDIQAGTISFEPTSEDRRQFRFEHFSILTNETG